VIALWWCRGLCPYFWGRSRAVYVAGTREACRLDYSLFARNPAGGCLPNWCRLPPRVIALWWCRGLCPNLWGQSRAVYVAGTREAGRLDFSNFARNPTGGCLSIWCRLPMLVIALLPLRGLRRLIDGAPLAFRSGRHAGWAVLVENSCLPLS